MQIRYTDQTFCYTLQTLKPLGNKFHILQKTILEKFQRNELFMYTHISHVLIFLLTVKCN